MEIANPKSKFGHFEDILDRIERQRIKIRDMEIPSPKYKSDHSEDLPDRIKSQRIKIAIWNHGCQLQV